MQIRHVVWALVLGLVFAAAAFGTRANAENSAGPITITGSDAVIQVGESTDIAFTVSTPPGSTGYGAITIDVHYDISKVVAEGNCVGGRATCNGNVNAPTGGPGLLRMTDASLGGVSEGVFGIVRFHGVGPGVVSFSYIVITCADSEGMPIAGCSGSGGGIDVTTSTGAITHAAPSVVVANRPDLLFTVAGYGFPADATVFWNESPLPTQFMSGEQLVASVSGSVIGNRKGFAEITIRDSGDLKIGPVIFTVLGSSSDVNCDGSADALDALDLVHELAGFGANPTSCGSNVNQQGNVDLADVHWIRKEVARLIPYPLPASLPDH